MRQQTRRFEGSSTGIRTKLYSLVDKDALFRTASLHCEMYAETRAATSVCPTYCNFCTRSYAVGANTDVVTKTSFKPTRRRWEEVFTYIEATPQLQDIVISGGDSYYLQPEHIRMIGERLIEIPHIRRFRFASKGLAVAPARIMDPEDDWAHALAEVASSARSVGKSVALHTHFNHPDELSWVTQEAAQRLFEAGVLVRNQTVLLRGVNDDVETMSRLIRRLADNNILPVSMVNKYSLHGSMSPIALTNPVYSIMFIYATW